MLTIKDRCHVPRSRSPNALSHLRVRTSTRANKATPIANWKIDTRVAFGTCGGKLRRLTTATRCRSPLLGPVLLNPVICLAEQFLSAKQIALT